jgi:DNA repair exonuclease SbcCD ATPase subunit
MTLTQKIFSLLFCTIALSAEQTPPAIAQFVNALDAYSQNQTPENAQAMLAEYDRPENLGKYRRILNAQVVQAGFTVNSLRVQAKQSSLAAAPKPLQAPLQAPTQEPAPSMEKTAQAPKAIPQEIKDYIQQDEQEIKKDIETLEKIVAELQQLEQELSEKVARVAAEEGLITDTALEINVNSIKGQQNDLQPLLDQTKKTMDLQKEVHKLETEIAAKLQKKIAHATQLKQKQNNLTKKRSNAALKKTQEYHKQIKNLSQSCRSN